MTTYTQALKSGKRAGMSRATDAEAMASFCEHSLQLLVGAVSPRLVWEGAQARGLTTSELAKLTRDPRAIDDLQWGGV